MPTEVAAKPAVHPSPYKPGGGKAAQKPRLQSARKRFDGIEGGQRSSGPKLAGMSEEGGDGTQAPVAEPSGVSTLGAETSGDLGHSTVAGEASKVSLPALGSAAGVSPRGDRGHSPEKHGETLTERLPLLPAPLLSGRGEDLPPRFRAILEDNKMMHEELRRYRKRAKQAETTLMATEQKLAALRAEADKRGIVRGPKPPGDGAAAATPQESEPERVARLEKELQIANHAKEAAQRVAAFRERDLQKQLNEAQAKLADAEERLLAAEKEHRRDLLKLKEALRRADEAEFTASAARQQAQRMEEEFREEFPRGVPDKDDAAAIEAAEQTALVEKVAQMHEEDLRAAVERAVAAEKKLEVADASIAAAMVRAAAAEDRIRAANYRVKNADLFSAQDWMRELVWGVAMVAMERVDVTQAVLASASTPGVAARAKNLLKGGGAAQGAAKGGAGPAARPGGGGAAGEKAEKGPGGGADKGPGSHRGAGGGAGESTTPTGAGPSRAGGGPAAGPVGGGGGGGGGNYPGSVAGGDDGALDDIGEDEGEEYEDVDEKGNHVIRRRRRQAEEEWDGPSHLRPTAAYVLKAAVAKALLEKQRAYEAEEKKKRAGGFNAGGVAPKSVAGQSVGAKSYGGATARAGAGGRK